jgi:hypothetical protein
MRLRENALYRDANGGLGVKRRDDDREGDFFAPLTAPLPVRKRTFLDAIAIGLHGMP